MKKIKKLLAMIMAMTMVLGLGLTSFAAIGGATITVRGLSTAASQKVTIYEIYRLDANDNDWVKAPWAQDVNVTPETLDQEAVVEALKDATTGLSADNQYIFTTTTVAGQREVEFDGLQAGAYLVLVNDSASKVVYSPMVAVTYAYDEGEDESGDGNETHLLYPIDADVVAKAESYSTDKSQTETGNDSVVEVGDLVTYKITTTVPFNNPEKPTTEFWVEDTITNATYYFSGEPVKGVEALWKVTVGGEIMTEKFGAPTPTTDANTQKFHLNLMSLIDKDNTYAGQEVVIEYTAKVSAADVITNKALSSHDPNAGDKDGMTSVKTGKIAITKIGEDENIKLKDAQFAVYRINEEDKKEYAGIDANNYITGQWYVETEEGKVPENAGTITTDDNGYAVVKGLDVGTYYFQEVVAPDGYSLNTEEFPTAVITVEDLDDLDAVLSDTKLASLPSTGGIGTTIFTIGGCAIMIAAAALYFVNRRKSEEN